MDDAPYPAIIIGLGNPILSDDGVGWRVVQLVRDAVREAGDERRVVVREACVGGLSLAELLVGFRRAIVIDAIMTGNDPPGTVSHLTLADLPGTLNIASAHDTNLVTALRALRRFGAELPPDDSISIVAVEVQDVWTFAEECTPAVEQAIPGAASLTLRVLRGE
jgi:hydrogenase maturation protease